MKKLLLSLATVMMFQSPLVFAWGQPEKTPDLNSTFDFFNNPASKTTLTQKAGAVALSGAMLSESGDKVLGGVALGSIALLGKMVIDNNNNLSHQYEEELLDNPGQEEANLILAKLQTMKFSENQTSGPGYLIFAKNIGIGEEFAQAQMDFENTNDYQQNLTLLKSYFNKFEQNPDWQEDYATFRYKRFIAFYTQNAKKYPALDESTRNFITQLSRLKREYDFLNNPDNGYLTTQQKEKIKQVFSCQNPNYRKMIYDNLFLIPEQFEDSYAYTLVSDEIWYKSGTLKKEQYQNKIGNNQFDMNSYSKLNNLRISYDHMENDHIPSYAAIREFMEKQGYDVSSAKSTLKRNTSTIAVLKLLHQHGRSWGNKNDSNLMSLDASDLKLATLKDFNTYIERMKDKAIFNGVNEYKTNDFDNIAKSISILYERNKLLCLYN
jgi:hypothetical protein